MDRLKRFEYCGDELFPYIEKVLEMLYQAKKESFLEDKDLQVVSSYKLANGFQYTFSSPVKSVIYINIYQIEKKFEKSCAVKDGLTKEDYLKYVIAHEMGHHYAGRGDSFLREKEANDWLINNGNFGDLINKIGYKPPIDEAEGFEYGYCWANKDKTYWSLQRFFPKWKLLNKKDLSIKEEFEIIKQLMGEVQTLDEKGRSEDYLKGIACGIMKKVRELSEENISAKRE
jgi:hypothetical protein